ncbi:hypothetical protein L208DRAFT_1397831, partial [Tricholoma matsutake]
YRFSSPALALLLSGHHYPNQTCGSKCAHCHIAVPPIKCVSSPTRCCQEEQQWRGDDIGCREDLLVQCLLVAGM